LPCCAEFFFNPPGTSSSSPIVKGADHFPRIKGSYSSSSSQRFLEESMISSSSSPRLLSLITFFPSLRFLYILRATFHYSTDYFFPTTPRGERIQYFLSIIARIPLLNSPSPPLITADDCRDCLIPFPAINSKAFLTPLQPGFARPFFVHPPPHAFPPSPPPLSCALPFASLSKTNTLLRTLSLPPPLFIYNVLFDRLPSSSFFVTSG